MQPNQPTSPVPSLTPDQKNDTTPGVGAVDMSAVSSDSSSDDALNYYPSPHDNADALKVSSEESMQIDVSEWGAAVESDTTTPPVAPVAPVTPSPFEQQYESLPQQAVEKKSSGVWVVLIAGSLISLGALVASVIWLMDYYQSIS